MGRKAHAVLTVREVQQQLPSLLAGFRAKGASAEPVVIGARRRPAGVVLSYERYLELLDGRDRVRAILDDRTAAGGGMDEDEAMALALEAQAAVRRGRLVKALRDPVKYREVVGSSQRPGFDSRAGLARHPACTPVI